MKSVRNVPFWYSHPYMAPIPDCSLYWTLQIVNDGVKTFLLKKVIIKKFTNEQSYVVSRNNVAYISFVGSELSADVVFPCDSCAVMLFARGVWKFGSCCFEDSVSFANSDLQIDIKFRLNCAFVTQNTSSSLVFRYKNLPLKIFGYPVLESKVRIKIPCVGVYWIV